MRVENTVGILGSVANTTCTAFLGHPRMYTADESGAFTCLDGISYDTVQTTPTASTEYYPNKATEWVRRHLGHVCAANVAVSYRGHLRVIDLLVRDSAAYPPPDAAHAYTAVFILFGDEYTHAMQHIRETQKTCCKTYGFRPKFLLLRITRNGALRRRWL